MLLIYIRKAESEGFFYNDILIKKWESGIDQGIAMARMYEVATNKNDVE